MFRKQLILTLALILGTMAASQVHARGDLKALANQEKPEAAVVITPEEFKQILEAIPKENLQELKEGVFAFDVNHAGFKLPFISVRTPSGIFIWNTIRLAPVPNDISPELMAQRMIKLLAASGEAGDFFFSFDEESRMITLHGCIQIQKKLTPEYYINHLITMVDIAIATENLWNPGKWDADEPKHIGRWESEANGMTLNLKHADRFELIVGQNVTKGNFKLEDNSLTMQDSNGEKLTAQIKFDNPNQFRLIVDGNVNVFVRQ